MYMIICYDRNTRHPEVFSSYKQACKVFKELNDNTNVLEYWNFKEQTRKSIIDRRRQDNRYGK